MKWLKEKILKWKAKRLQKKVEAVSVKGGVEVGKAFKTIFSRLHRAKVIDSLRAVGVEAKDERGKVKPGIVVLQDLAKVFPELPTEVRNSLIQQIAGLKNATVFRALMKHV